MTGSKNARVATLLAALSLAGPAAAEGIALPGPTRPPARLTPPSRSPTDPVERRVAAEIFSLARERPDDLKALIKEVLCTYIENPDTVEVAIDLGSPIQRLAGRIRRVEVSMRDTIIKGLRLDRAFILLEDASLDLAKLVRDRKFRFREKGKTEFLFEVSEPAINELLDKKAGKLKVRNAKLRLKDGHMTFNGRVKVLFFNNHVRLDGRLFEVNGTEVHFAPRQLRLDFLPIPPFVLGMIRKKINPLADLKNFRFNVEIGAIETTRNRILLSSKGLAEVAGAQARAERRGEPTAWESWPPAAHTRLLAAGDPAP